MKRSTSMTSPPTATRRCLEPAPMDSSVRCTPIRAARLEADEAARSRHRATVRRRSPPQAVTGCSSARQAEARPDQRVLAAVLDALIGTTAATDALPAAPRQLRLETEERVAEAVARAGAPRSFTVCLWSDGFTVRAEGLPAAPPASRGNVVGLADFAEPAGPLQSYGDHLPFLRAIRDGEVPPQFLPGGDVVRLDVEDYLPCSYAQCRHLLDAAPAHVAPRLPAAELRAKRLARFAT